MTIDGDGLISSETCIFQAKKSFSYSSLKILTIELITALPYEDIKRRVKISENI
jgi:hypothetical protein